MLSMLFFLGTIPRQQNNIYIVSKIGFLFCSILFLFIVFIYNIYIHMLYILTMNCKGSETLQYAPIHDG